MRKPEASEKIKEKIEELETDEKIKDFLKYIFIFELKNRGNSFKGSGYKEKFIKKVKKYRDD